MPGSRVVLCADDFGLTEGVSYGILDLIGMERLSAVSVLVNGAAWAQTGPELARLKPRIGIGVHLVLPPSRAVARSEIALEIARQIARFCDVTGFTPDFISGQDNAHVFPHFRSGLFLALERTGLAGDVWLRDPSERLTAILKRGRGRVRAITAKILALGFAGQARRRGIATNDGFSGFASHDRNYPVEREFQRFFQHLGPRPIITCRPGYVDDALGRLDKLVESRSRELMYLSSTRFTDLLDVLRITLVPSPVEPRTMSSPLNRLPGLPRQ